MVGAGVGGVGGFGEGNVGGCAEFRVGGEGVDGEGGQAGTTFGEDEEGLEEVEVFQGDVGWAGVEFAPVVARGVGGGGDDEPEVFGGVVGADEEEAVAVVGVVFEVVLAGGR